MQWDCRGKGLKCDVYAGYSWFVSRVRILLGALLAYPLLPVFLLVGGGFFVLPYPVVSGGFRWFPAPYVVELHGRFSPLKRKKDPHH